MMHGSVSISSLLAIKPADITEAEMILLKDRLWFDDKILLSILDIFGHILVSFYAEWKFYGLDFFQSQWKTSFLDV